MKVLFVIQALGYGGAERVTTSLANYWAKKGWEITIVTVGSARDDSYKLNSGIQRIALDLATEGGNVLTGVPNNIRRIRALRKVLRRTSPDVAVGMMTRASIVLALAARGLNISTIGSERSYPARLPPNSLWGRLRRWSFGRLNAVAAQTDEAKTWLQSNTLARRVTVIPNPMEWPIPVQNPVIHPADVIPKEKHVLLAVGRLEHVKGFDYLIDAFARLAPDHPDWILAIVGSGPDRQALEAQIAQRGLTSKVLLPGTAGNISQWYSSADLFVLTSRFEGFPNALIEALAHGLPAVSFDCKAGPRDIIRHDKDGFLVPAGDVSALASGIADLMSDRAKRGIFSANAIEARERFSIERIANMWEALFLGVASERA